MQAQIQALIAGGVGGVGRAGAEREATGSNMGSQMEVAKPPVFNREAGRVGEEDSLQHASYI